MSTKSAKIADLLTRFPAHHRYPPQYSGYFHCFNAGLYYEAHDVLEDLWLRDRRGPDGAFYQGLIQFAGGFVHLRKGRLAPAWRLFGLALRNLEPYPQRHHGLSVLAVRRIAEDFRASLEASRFAANPWSDAARPHLALEA